VVAFSGRIDPFEARADTHSISQVSREARPATVDERASDERNSVGAAGDEQTVPISWPVILSGVVWVAMLALGFNLLLPLGSGLDTVCVLTGVASARVFFGLVEDA
jgi:hypothetical protein